MHKALTRSQQLFNIHPGEGRLVGLAFLLYLFLSIPYVLFYTAAYALFLEEFQAEGLSYYYLVAAPLLFLATLAGLRAASRLSLSRFLQAIVVLLLAGTLAFWIGLQLAPGRGVTFGLVIWKDFMYVFVTIAFWTGANSLFNVRQSKRLFPVISTASSIAAIAGGLLIPGLVALAGAANLVLWAGLLLVPAVLLQYRIFKSYASLMKTPPAEQPGGSRAGSSGRELRDPYILMLFGMIFLFWVSYLLVSTIFYERAELQYPDIDQLASFIGWFSLVSGAIMLVMDSFISGRVMEKTGLKTSLLAMPLCLVVISLALLAAGWYGGALVLIFVLAMVMNIANDGLTGLTLSAQQVLYQPLPASLRVRIQSIVEGIVGSAASAAAGLLLIWLDNEFGSDAITMTAVQLPLLLAWLWIVFPITRHYLLWLERALKRRQINDELVLVLDPAGLEVLKRELASPFPEAVIYAAARLEQAEPRTLESLVIGLIAHPHEWVRQDALQRAARLNLDSALPQARDLAVSDPSPLVRSAAVQALFAFQRSEDRSLLMECMHEPASQVRRQALTGFLCSGAWSEMRIARRRLGELAASSSPAERLDAAEVLQAVGRRSQFRLALGLIYDTDRSVRTAALLAAGRLAHPYLWPVVLSSLGERTDSAAAGQAIAAGLQSEAPGLIDQVEGVLVQELLAAPLTNKRLYRLARACGDSANPALAPLLLRMFDQPDIRLREWATIGLWSCSYRVEAVAMPAFSQRIDAEVACAAWLLVAAADLPGQDHFILLKNALNQQVQAVADRVLFFLAMMNSDSGQAETILKARRALRSWSPQAHAFAVDVLDALIPRPWKATLLPLLENLPLGEKLRRLPADLRLGRKTPAGRIEEIIRSPRGCLGRAIQPWALYTAALEPGLGLQEAVAAAARSEEPYIKETALWAAAQLSNTAEPGGGIKMLTTIERIIVLKLASLFKEIPDEYLVDLAGLLEEVPVPAGRTIIQKGEIGDCLYIIVTGRVRVHTGETTLNTLEARQVFGEMALLDQEARSASVTALEDSLLLRLDQEPFYELMEESIDFTRGVIRALTYKIRTTETFEERAAQAG